MSTQTSSPSSARAMAQRFGTFLSGMIMPNIGAFIAWGLITAFFIEAGFTPYGPIGGFGTDADGNTYTGMVGPMITYLLPLLIGYTGGKMIHDTRGGVVGAIATMGVIVGSDIPMFIGAMIMGPLTAWLMKKLDSLWAGKIKPGLEMLVDNFSAGIFAAIMAAIGFFLIGPAVKLFSEGAAAVVDFLVSNGLLPLTSIFIEPAKILFLNNAINHGILTPIGTQQALEQGKSLLFLLEANPGPGLGILLAYGIFGRGASRASAWGAALIHFIGGIHEIYFPYVLMKPILIIAAIAGGMTGVFTLNLLGGGVRAPAAPGSIIAILIQSPPSAILANVVAVIAATVVSFVIAALLLRLSRKRDEEMDLAAATSQMEAMKGKKSSVAGALAPSDATGPVRRIVFACDAGMGSSAMGASVLRNKIKEAGHPEVEVKNSAIANLTDDWDIMVVHQDLAERAKVKAPGAWMVTVDNFMGSPRYDEVVEEVNRRNNPDAAPAPVGATTTAPDTPAQDGSTAQAARAAEGSPVTHSDATPSRAIVDEAPAGASGAILSTESVVMDGTGTDATSAINEAGALLVARGAVTEAYVEAMHEREKSVSTFMGEGLAIPHGTNEAKAEVHSSAMSVVRYPNGVDWNGNQAKWVIGIAGRDNEHLEILANVARIFGDKAQVEQLNNAATAEEVVELLGKVNQ
ncbi:PTS mannitol transporter subunit IICBA [Enemella sp. A6]|uniref:PTS mannitol transporter subunit IICBA n=1 Tax=Enemella sp. A6 TaxID=3440152 RepID=UPI003EBBAC5F